MILQYNKRLVVNIKVDIEKKVIRVIQMSQYSSLQYSKTPTSVSELELAKIPTVFYSKEPQTNEMVPCC